MDRLRTGMLTLALGAMAACHDLPLATAPAPVVAGDRGAVRCSADVAARTVSCGANGSAGGARNNLLLGGQEVNVRLTSSNVRYGNGLLQAEVTVQNLLDQPMGTDGATITGVRVFFASGPAVTEGSGTVTVLADGTGTFTAAGQPFYQYDGVIEPQAVSPARTWSFSLDPGVVRFDFVVYVDTPLPGEESILHWRTEQAALPYSGALSAVSAASPNAVFATGADTVLYFDGTGWRALAGAGCFCTGIWAASADLAFAVGPAVTVRRWSGGEWTSESDPDLTGKAFRAVWGSATDDVWAVGGNGQIVHFDGTDWMEHESNGPTLMAVWGSGPTDVWAVGFSGTLLHWNGSGWISYSRSSPALDFFSVWGSAPDDVWAVGYVDCACGPGVAYHWNGTVWSLVTDLPDVSGTMLTSVRGTARDDVWITTYTGMALHYDGTGWSMERAVPSGTQLYGIATLSAGDVVAVGTVANSGVVVRNHGAGWEPVAPSSERLSGVWGSSADDVWAVGGRSIVHRTDGAWSSVAAPEGIRLEGVWGSSAGDVWAVGDSGVVHYDGAFWSRVSGVTVPLYSVWGASRTDVWAGGDQSMAHWNGTEWITTPMGIGRFTAVWGSAAADVFAVSTLGEIYRWNGSAWTPMSSGTGLSLYGVWGTGPDNVYAVGRGIVLHYDGNAAGTWTQVPTPPDATLAIEAVWGTGPDDVSILADAGKSLLHWNGSAWRKLTTFLPGSEVRMHALWGTSGRDAYVVGDMGTILHGGR